MTSALESYIRQLAQSTSTIPNERVNLLEEIASYIAYQHKEGRPINLVFICTHNSRRSHLSQIWAATLAFHFDIDGVDTYSGGTEATAFNIRAVNALHKAGFGVINPGGTNPHYAVNFHREAKTLIAYSKVYDAPENPKTGFAALMTCSEADEACPIVLGADVKYALLYDDPKEADDTPWEADAYEERLKQIGTEIYYLMKQAKAKIDG